MSTERLIDASVFSARGRLNENGIQILNQYEDSRQSSTSSGIGLCCTPMATGKRRVSFISFYEILWCQWSDVDSRKLEVTYVNPKAEEVIPEVISIDIDQDFVIPTSPASESTDICQEILAQAYKSHIISPSIAVIINPHGGKGKAAEIYKKKIAPILRAANVKVEYIETKHHEHAVQIARELEISKFDIVACCSGDGIPHEVINGFYQRPDNGLSAFQKIAVTQLPCGSGNALSLSTHGSNDASVATFSMLKSHRVKLDLMAILQKSSPITKLSFLTQCFGIIADSDIGTEHLRWMGPVRFEIGVMGKILSGAKYPCDVFVEYAVELKHDLETHFQQFRPDTPSQNQVQPESPALSASNLIVHGPAISDPIPLHWVKLPENVTNNLNIFYVGKMPYISSNTEFFPAALPNDGTMDMIITGTDIGILESVNILLSVEKGLHVNNDKVIHSKIKSYRLVPKLKNIKNHYISIDGENCPIEPIQAELLPGVLTGLLPDGSYVKTSFNK